MAFSGDATLLILDEPTNHLDDAGRKTLAEWIAQRGRGVVVISHDSIFEAVDAVCWKPAERRAGLCIRTGFTDRSPLTAQKRTGVRFFFMRCELIVSQVAVAYSARMLGVFSAYILNNEIHKGLGCLWQIFNLRGDFRNAAACMLDDGRAADVSGVLKP
ncbi:MAG: hypothetical protein ACLSCO_17815 [Gallintestinimicrobium sp.]